MSWQDRFPEIAKGFERIEERKAFIQRTTVVHKKTTREEDRERLSAKKEKLRESHPDIYKSLPDAQEPDWGALISTKDPFRK